ncbi:MAG: sigma-70 family RNA polymerase sigma factor [Planctomycetota bacterium]
MPVTPDQIIQTIIKQRSALIGYAWVVVGDADTAEDVLQDVSLAAVKKADQIIDADHLAGWLRHAIRLRGLEIRRKQLKQARLLAPDVLDLLEKAHQRQPADDAERMAALRQCIPRLSENAQKTLALRYGESIKPSDIATQTGRSLKSVYQVITRAHAALRECVRLRLIKGGTGR